jgi:hypothetical protein
VPHRS